MARDVVQDLVDITQGKKLPPAVIAKGKPTSKKAAAKAAPKAAPKVAAPKPDLKGALKVITRGAKVEQAEEPKMAKAPRRQAVPYTDEMKITMVEGARKYREGGNVEKAVLIMKKVGTVGKYRMAMAETDNPLPPIGLLRFLHKKQCVTVG